MHWNDASTISLLNKVSILLYFTTQQKVLFKLAQINRYDWLDDQIIDSCINNIKKITNHNSLVFEVHIDPVHHVSSNKEILFNGRLDAVDNTYVWEFKCVDKLLLEHKLQCLIYFWLWSKSMIAKHGTRKFRLYNIKTNELLEIKEDCFDDLLEIVEIIINNKFAKSCHIPDELFINSLQKL